MKIHIDETESTVNFLSSTENGLNLVLNYTLSKDSNGEATVLYKVFDVNQFVSSFLGEDIKLLDEKKFLLPSLYLQIEKYAFGTDICVKHVFSSIVGVHCLDEKRQERFTESSFVRF